MTHHTSEAAGSYLSSLGIIKCFAQGHFFSVTQDNCLTVAPFVLLHCLLVEYTMEHLNVSWHCLVYQSVMIWYKVLRTNNKNIMLL